MDKDKIIDEFERKFIELVPDGSTFGGILRVIHTNSTKDREILENIKKFLISKLEEVERDARIRKPYNLGKESPINNVEIIENNIYMRDDGTISIESILGNVDSLIPFIEDNVYIDGEYHIRWGKVWEEFSLYCLKELNGGE